MKNTILIGLLISLAINGFAQKGERVIGVNQQFNEEDTTRTFSILADNKDRCREILIAEWGQPETNEAGLVIWKDVRIDGLDKSVEIRLNDGIFTRKVTRAMISPFSSFEQKSKKLEKLKKNEYRFMEIVFTGSDGRNFINSSDLEKLMVDLLENKLKN